MGTKRNPRMRFHRDPFGVSFICGRLSLDWLVQGKGTRWAGINFYPGPHLQIGLWFRAISIVW